MHLHRLDLNKCSNSFYQNLVTVEGQKCETEWPLSDVCLRNRNMFDFIPIRFLFICDFIPIPICLTWYGLPEPGERVVRVPVMTMARVGLSGHSLRWREVQPRHVLTLKHVALQHVNMSTCNILTCHSQYFLSHQKQPGCLESWQLSNYSWCWDCLHSGRIGGSAIHFSSFT